MTPSDHARMPGFVGGTLDRADHVRTNPAILAQAFRFPRACRLVLDGLDPVMEGAMLATEPLPADARIEDHVLLGVDDDRPIFAALSPDVPHAAGAMQAVWAMAPLLAPDQLALYGGARSLIDWHARHRFCSACGNGTTPHKAGWSRRCDMCKAEHFPRVDPVTIMLAEQGGRVLLGRQPGFAPGRYSALAGFVEPGETVEEAVARELWEEAGITVHSVRYVMSQPWPFPSSLMLACMAQTDDDTLTLDETEIEHAFWCDAAGVRAALAGDAGAPFVAPPDMAIASHLLRHWLDSL
ncbi:MAG: NAD(+) diphosphatase [Sphingobium sp.]